MPLALTTPADKNMLVSRIISAIELERIEMTNIAHRRHFAGINVRKAMNSTPDATLQRVIDFDVYDWQSILFDHSSARAENEYIVRLAAYGYSAYMNA